MAEFTIKCFKCGGEFKYEARNPHKIRRAYCLSNGGKCAKLYRGSKDPKYLAYLEKVIVGCLPGGKKGSVLELIMRLLP